MSAHNQDPNEVSASLTLALRVDSGYEADAEFRITATQWGEVIRISKHSPLPAMQINERPARG